MKPGKPAQQLTITCLPGSAAKKVADMGTLDIKSGILKINPKLQKLLKKHEVWVDYNKKIYKDSYKKSPNNTKKPNTNKSSQIPINPKHSTEPIQEK